jgi:hypothetical protein
MPGPPGLADPRREEQFLEATLDSVSRCPARDDYIELHFTTAAGSWEWCFPDPSDHPADDDGSGPGSLALTLGTYGVQARLLHDGVLGYAVQSASALPMILAGVPVSVDRKLLRAGR